MAPRAQIVFLPGLLCDARVFEAQTRALAPFAATKVPDFTQAASITEMGQVALAEFDGPVTLGVSRWAGARRWKLSASHRRASNVWS